ncbi:MAG TPA: KUP/HAK/KT family potassium transporter, partial [Methylophilaceae bacterium]
MQASVPKSKPRMAALSLAALGVVYGDIGTSPLYTMHEVFAGSHHPVPVSTANVLGILSLILWSLIMVVTVKYVTIIMRADNRGEGGIMALIALASQQSTNRPRRLHFIMLVGILGACMFYADGMITPAISVLSAVEGLEIAAPMLSEMVIPVTLLVLFALFWSQRRGTGAMGKMFGPIMLVWFATLAVLGVHNVMMDTSVLRAFNPMYGVHFFTSNPKLGFISLGAVVLAVTGGEALYADMGHFGRIPIRIAWYTVVLPALVVNYFGQGALILHNPAALENSFYLMAPHWMLLPLVVLATLATVIASQAVISGAFSMSRQALQLGYLPRMLVQHTSDSHEGQIYLPRINWGLMIAVMGLVVGFKSSANLAAAYGIAVTGNMAITTVLSSLVFHKLWGWSWARTIVLTAIFLFIDLAFFSANLLKIFDGGWAPILIVIITFTLMTTWKRGRSMLHKRLESEAMALDMFIAAIGAHPPTRVQGSAVFMTPNPNGVPHSLLHNLKHNKVLHEQVVIATVKFHEVPRMPQEERIVVEDMTNGFYRVTINYGFSDEPDLPRDLE